MSGVWEATFKSVLTIAAISTGCRQAVALGSPQKWSYWCLWRSCYLSPLRTRFLFFKLVWEIWACSPTSQWLRPLVVDPVKCSLLIPSLLAGVLRTEKSWILWKGFWRCGCWGYAIILSWPKSWLVLRGIVNIWRHKGDLNPPQAHLSPIYLELSSRTQSPNTVWHSKDPCKEVVPRSRW